MEIRAIKTRVFRENEDLLQFVLKYVKKLPERSILVVASKVVALSEGRTAEIKSSQEKINLIKKESNFAVNTKEVFLTIKDGAFMANAGIDESNGDGRLIFLPKDSFISAQKIRSFLCKHYKIKNLGVVISDSGLLPLRSGVIGMARGYAGFKGIKDYTKILDIFGRKFTYSKTNIADSLSTAATLCMGEGGEQQPIAVVSNAQVVFTGKINKRELAIDPTRDIFYPLLKNINAKKQKK